MFAALINDQKKDSNPMHLVMFALVAASILWISYLVFKNHTLPELGGVAELLGGGAAANVAHKMEDIVAKFKKPETEEKEKTDGQ